VREHGQQLVFQILHTSLASLVLTAT
jgi:hypothetical protein